MSNINSNVRGWGGPKLTWTTIIMEDMFECGYLALDTNEWPKKI